MCSHTYIHKRFSKYLLNPCPSCAGSYCCVHTCTHTCTQTSSKYLLLYPYPSCAGKSTKDTPSKAGGGGGGGKETGDVRRFLNRLLGLPVAEQNLLFAYFTAVLAAEVCVFMIVSCMCMLLHVFPTLKQDAIGQNYIYICGVRYFWQGNHTTYGQIRCKHTVLANPVYITSPVARNQLIIRHSLLLVVLTLPSVCLLF
jgi:hypothetical protein